MAHWLKITQINTLSKSAKVKRNKTVKINISQNTRNVSILVQ